MVSNPHPKLEMPSRFAPLQDSKLDEPSQAISALWIAGVVGLLLTLFAATQTRPASLLRPRLESLKISRNPGPVSLGVPATIYYQNTQTLQRTPSPSGAGSRVLSWLRATSSRIHQAEVSFRTRSIGTRPKTEPFLCASAALRQRAKVYLVHDEELVSFLPVRVAIVEIELNDGARLSERVTAVRGTPRNPMSRTEVIDKARDLIAPVLGRDKSERLIERVFGIETLTNVLGLRPLLQPG